MALLVRAAPSVVKTRSGSVLSRGFILKTDHYPSGRALDLELDLQSAPNFRMSRVDTLNVFGVAQPRLQGLQAILAVLRCDPAGSPSSQCIWFCTREEPIIYISGRPFVLRDSAAPRSTLHMSDRVENLEAIEMRLKLDILTEAAKYGGLILTHNELADVDSTIVPTWTAVNSGLVKTAREVWEDVAKEGWRVEPKTQLIHPRIPISPDRPIEDNYLDAYVRVLNSEKASDVHSTSLVFNCGMGVVRTTFAMVAASLVRRKQLLIKGLADPFGGGFGGSPRTYDGTSTPPEVKVRQSMMQAGAQQEFSRSLLRLTYLLQKSLSGAASQSVTEILLQNPVLLDNLRKAHQGSYGIVLSLLGCLDNGLAVKQLVDRVIDSCDHVCNLREEVLSQRVKYSLMAMDERRGLEMLDRAVRALEKYFFLIAFASYVEDQHDFAETFSDWMKTRVEIWNQVMFLRKSSKHNVLAPINDLSALSKSSAERSALQIAKQNDMAVSGGQILGDEYADHVLKNRSGIILRASTLLKSDLWLLQSKDSVHAIRGVMNFRNIKGTRIYALGQPSTDAIDEVISQISRNNPQSEEIIWITLREEPIVYINGSPYCLRRDGFTLRNMKDYGGISASRIELLEQRLKEDVIAELNSFDGKILLHSEEADGSITPTWEDVASGDVHVLKEIMEKRQFGEGRVKLVYHRVPITSEQSPDFSDISQIWDVITRSDLQNNPIVLNDQLGRGRSTMASMIVFLLQRWLSQKSLAQSISMTRMRSTKSRRRSSATRTEDEVPRRTTPKQSYQPINNLLRVIRNGLVVKAIVDEAVDRCGELSFNLLDSIEDSRLRAEHETDKSEKKYQIHRGRHNLLRYFTLILFQAYLESAANDTLDSMGTFEQFVKSRPEFKTFEDEIFAEGVDALKPLYRIDIADGLALPDEEKQVVANRSGAILSASTILKSDYFSGLRKMSLPEQIDGAPNFRVVSMKNHTFDDIEIPSLPDGITHSLVCGSGMPTVDGLRRTLQRLGAHQKGGKIIAWTSLREEPVLYVAGRPHVLRLVDEPLENVRATGITTQIVEGMENSLKADVIREVRAGKGTLLLHDEEAKGGRFTITPQWETVKEEDIMTPRDVYELMIKEGYKVDYMRIAITDEQAPLPEALALLLDRVVAGQEKQCDFVFNCQMGRGRTTTGMIVAALIEWTRYGSAQLLEELIEEDLRYDSFDGISEEDAYLRGEFKAILKLIGVLSYGKLAKRLADHAIDLMSDIQNLRKAVYDYKLKLDAADHSSENYARLLYVAQNYLSVFFSYSMAPSYTASFLSGSGLFSRPSLTFMTLILSRYAALIVFANYLIEAKEKSIDFRELPFPMWLKEHREISTLLARHSLD
ncbi:hypothetical protein SISSUDRAFT_1069720 [Sistotremastrum suecicum HHB10207 ss-3]|uniref:Paladin n=1 Tax=Sistotremastrum suecicum HHB10207 ss-3 TaxID=1314776 RepID=A0A166GNP1_9AGAM|nr:hypothetical protein SISSUDRAFT_1069720 [Sistotremastrum suecicum HHB10207 ss-3]